MKRAYVTPILLGLSLLAPPAVLAQDPFQRHFTFKNDLGFTIYPVIQTPQGVDELTGNPVNCGTGGLLRIIVNQGSNRNGGIPPGGIVSVAIPKNRPCAANPPDDPTKTDGGFYDAARIYILIANREKFEKLAPTNTRTDAALAQSRNHWNPAWDQDLCGPANACFVGAADGDYGFDAPAQLLEYTVDSINPADGSRFKNANHTKGFPFIDFDVSYVDDAYLPVAMAVAEWATPFMGSLRNPTQFNSALTAFLTNPNTKWSEYAAFTSKNWNKTVFDELVTRTDKTPSAAILINLARTGGTSSYYMATRPTTDKYPTGYPTWCQDTMNLDHMKVNWQCYAFDHKTTADNPCCPNSNGVMLGCCDIRNYVIDNTFATYDPGAPGASVEGRVYRNDTLTSMTKRWADWLGPNNPCTSTPFSPAVDKNGFCAQFKKTLDFVWAQFVAKDKAQAKPVCDSLKDDPAKFNECILARIIGYDKLDGYKPDLCKKCPSEPCPPSCVQEVQLNECVQALQRGVPWGGADTNCTNCPSESCPKSCVIPSLADINFLVPRYHRDKFLHFWAPYDSPYNLNPYARFVHNRDDGLAAPGAYSFSIDDFYGNFGGPGSTLIVDVGGTSALKNPNPYDPFQQYRANVGPGWHHLTICGRAVTPSDPTKGVSFPISFYNEGQKQSTCEVVLYADAAQTQFAKFRVGETLAYPAIDTYTNVQQNLTGLRDPNQPKGLKAVRSQATIPGQDSYCLVNRQNVPETACIAYFTPQALDSIEAYVGVSNEPCTDPFVYNCGRPLTNLNLPPAPGH